MKVFHGAITQLAGQGHLTLQVPDATIGYPQPGVESAPDDWFIFVNHSSVGPRVRVGRETGFLHLSRKGWKANRKLIKAAFEKSPNKQETWADFEKYVAGFFAKLEKNRERCIQAIRKSAKEKIAQLKAAGK